MLLHHITHFYTFLGRLHVNFCVEVSMCVWEGGMVATDNIFVLILPLLLLHFHRSER